MEKMSLDEAFCYLTSDKKLLNRIQKYIAQDDTDAGLELIRRNVKCNGNIFSLWVDLKDTYNIPATNPYIGKIAPKEHKPYQEPVSTKPVVKCPYCGSTDVKKISTASRMASVGMFGIASKKIGKQWHCNGCKSEF